MNAVDAIMAAFVADRMNLCRVREDARIAIAADRIVLPASLPQFVGGFQKVLSGVIALIMDAGRGQAHAACATVEIASDDVPADATVGKVVERRETARQLI